jgi:hypothetical protein
MAHKIFYQILALMLLVINVSHAKQYHFTNEPIDVVIPSVGKDLETLELCIQGIQENCAIRRVIVISAQRLTDKAEWFDENQFPFSKQEVALWLCSLDEKKAETFTTKPKSRLGWYYQQLLKLYSPFVIPDISSNVLVLDSDTIFLNPVSFVNEKGAGLYNPGKEYHEHYFVHGAKLLSGFKKLYPNVSGISHHMLIQRPVLKDLFNKVKKQHKIPFWQAFCKFVTFEHSGASEYEIYFNFVFSRSKQVEIRHLLWRNIASLENMQTFKEKGYHYVSCHAYMREKKEQK